MKINIHRISGDDMRFSFKEPAAHFGQLCSLAAGSDLAFEQPLSGALRVTMVKDVIRVTGEFSTIVTMTCSRCLKRFDHLLASSLSLVFAQQPPEEKTESLPDDYEISAYQAGLVYFSGDEIDLHEPLAEQVIMALPFKPLCDPACKGLCSRCGENLNEAVCRCDKTPPDNPFTVLKNLKIG